MEDLNGFFSREGNLLGQSFINEAWIIERFSSDQLWVWGSGGSGQLGTNDTDTKTIPVTTFAGGDGWRQCGSSGLSGIAIKSNGTLWVWGQGSYGQLGINTSNDSLTPVTTFAGGRDWKQFSSLTGNTAAIKTDGTLWVWGGNSKGQLGTNNAFFKYTPVTTFAGGNYWKQIACGSSHMAAIKTNGTLWTWGSDNTGGSGYLGINNPAGYGRSTPVTTFAGGNDWKQVSCGRIITAAIKTDGTLWTWGTGESLGQNLNAGIFRKTPVTTFAGGTNWKQVFCGLYSVGAIKTDGTLWVWGENSNGQLGTNDNITRSIPVTTFAGGNNWKSYSISNYNSAAIKNDGSLWVWGWNQSSFLGLGNNTDTTDRLTPVTTFAGGNNWKQVCSDYQRYFAITTGPEFDIFGKEPIEIQVPPGQQAYTTSGTFSWTCPDNVYSVCVVCVGGGGRGGGAGGGGGGLGWKNNIPVNPGQSYTVVVGSGGVAGGANGTDSFFINTLPVRGGGGTNGWNGGTGGSYTGDGGGTGGSGSSLTTWGGGGGGAGGYSGNGGNANTLSGSNGSGGGGGGGAGHSSTDSNDSKRKGGGGGGVGIYGQGSNGSGAPSTTYGGDGGGGGSNGNDGNQSNGSSGGAGGLYGGGSGGANESPSWSSGQYGGTAGEGAVRIIWGNARAFPSTNTEDL